MVWMKTRKGRGYGKFDYSSHGAPHKLNSSEYWETKRPFMETYGVEFEGFGEAAPSDPEALRTQVRNNMAKVANVLRGKTDAVEYLANRLVELGDAVPKSSPTFALGGGNPVKDASLFDFENFPAELWAAARDARSRTGPRSRTTAAGSTRCASRSTSGRWFSR